MKRGILFVCTGNTCRSPSAEGVLRSLARSAGMLAELDIGSAGVSPSRIGEAPSKLAQACAIARGYDLSGLRARQVTTGDLAQFDFVLAMERDHLRQLAAMSPPMRRASPHLLLEHAPHLGLQEIPDPWNGGPADYERALDLIEAGCRGLLAHLRTTAPTTRHHSDYEK